MVCFPRRTTQHVNARCQSWLLPLFAEAAHSIAMIKHAITVVMKAVEHLNPGQAAVIAFDQPLYALANTHVQYTRPESSCLHPQADRVKSRPEPEMSARRLSVVPEVRR